MAKISISIPDDLAEQLDTYAEETGFKRSAAVAHILTDFFASEARSPESIDQTKVAELEEDIDQLQAYLADLHQRKPKQFPRPEWVEKPRVRSLAGRYSLSNDL